MAGTSANSEPRSVFLRNRKNGATPIQPSDLKHREKVAAAVVRHHKQTVQNAKRVNDTQDKIRRFKLEQDEWTMNVRSLFVDCRGCSKTIKLDGRNPDSYYRTNWIKHKRICRKILEAKNRQDVAASGSTSEIVKDDKILTPSTNHVWKPTSHCLEGRIDYPATLRSAEWTEECTKEETELENEPYFSDTLVTTKYFGNTRGFDNSTPAFTYQVDPQAHPLIHRRSVLYENNVGPAYSFQHSEYPCIYKNNTEAYNDGFSSQIQEKERHAVEFLTILWKSKGQTRA